MGTAASSPTGDETTRPEVKINSDWAGECAAAGDAAAPKPKLLRHDQRGRAFPPGCMRIDDVFTPGECRRLVTRAEVEGGFGRTNYRKTYRGNLRLITVDKGLAAVVWARLHALVPATVTTHGGGAWRAVGLNECWRLAKYHPGDQFGRHYDTCFERSAKERSMFTVNIYMNHCALAPGAADSRAAGDPVFVGGATRFFNGRNRKAGPTAAMEPAAGSCVVFRQPPEENLWHDGAAVTEGLKYLFRTDVMYRRIAPGDGDGDGSGGGNAASGTAAGETAGPSALAAHGAVAEASAAAAVVGGRGDHVEQADPVEHLQRLPSAPAATTTAAAAATTAAVGPRGDALAAAGSAAVHADAAASRRLDDPQ